MPRPELESFLTFVKRHVSILVTAAATPILAGFFDLVPPPKTQGDDRFIASMTAIICALILVALFWRRYAIVRTASDKWLIGGVVIAIFGLSLLAFYRTIPDPTTPTWTLLRVSLYVAGFPMFCAGAVIVFLYGFVRGEDVAQFAKVVNRLENEYFKALEIIAQALEYASSPHLDGASRMPETVRKAFRESSLNVIYEASERMKKLSKGQLEIWGPSMDTVYSNFGEAIEKSFIAISRDDLDFWTKPYSGKYLQENSNLIARKCSVERIFLISRSRLLENAHRDALEHQIGIGINVRIAHLEDLYETHSVGDADLDFGLFDNFAVSFFKFTHGRLFRITVDQREYQKYKHIYGVIKSLCLIVPEKSAGDLTLIESHEELKRLLHERERRQIPHQNLIPAPADD